MEKLDNRTETACPCPSGQRGIVVAFVLAALGTIGFGLIAFAVVHDTEIVALDSTIAQTFRDNAAPDAVLTGIMIALSAFGAWVGMTIVHLLGVLWQISRKQWLLVAAWALIPATGAILNVVVKKSYERHRPPIDWRDPSVDESSFSFPSGHAMGAGVGMTVIAYMFCVATCSRRARLLIVTAATLVGLGVGFSRIYLRAHWFSDVLAGLFLGAAWAAICLGVVEFFRRRTACPQAATRD